MTVNLLHLSSSIFGYFYEYWFHTSQNAEMRMDVTAWLLYLLILLVQAGLYCIYILSKICIVPIQFLTFVILWWPKLYWSLWSDPNGRSFYQIMTNPRYASSDGFKDRGPQAVSRATKRNFIAKGKLKIKPISTRMHCYSFYQVDGAYAHVGQKTNASIAEAIQSASTPILLYYDDPCRIAVAYNYFAARRPEPPDNDFLRGLACLLISAIFLLNIFRGFLVLSWRRFRLNFTRKDPSADTTRPEETVPSYVALATSDENNSQTVMFDSDGISFVIDNSATCIICNDRNMFVGKLEVENSVMETANGTSNTSYVGTIRIGLMDDTGQTNQYDIPGAVYNEGSPFNIIGIPFLGDFFGSKDAVPSSDDDGTTIKSSASRSHFVWDHGKHERHFDHGARRLPELTIQTGFGYFSSFCTRVRRNYHDTVHYAFSSAYSVTPDKVDPVEDAVTPSSDFVLGRSLLFKDGKGVNELVVYEGASSDGQFHTIRKADGTKCVTPESHLRLKSQPDLSNIPSTPLDYCKEVELGISKEEAQALAYPRVLSPSQQELMSWHHRLYHLPFWRMFQLASKGYLPKILLDCKEKPPLCVACQFGTAHRRPWRTKGKKAGSIRREEHKVPGDGVSIDQIVSAQPGLIPQMAGFLTSDRIWGATTFCDHVSDFVYVHLMRNFTLEETLLAKKAWEKLLAQADRKVKHYHADNGRFSDNGFLESVNNNDQKITFCGVGAHHQNGIIENKNKQLTLGARTLLLHGMRMWPQMIDTMFWPFAMKAFAARMDILHVDLSGETPESKMYGVPAGEIPVKNYHTLFCPVYALDARLQSAGGAGPPKWEPRSRIGVYLGHSPFHAGSVALVFNPTTGRVSPQYHVVFDDDFTTVPFMEAGEVPPNWSDLCKHSAESATDESVDMALEWISGLSDVEKDCQIGTANQITNPFAVVPDQLSGNAKRKSTTNDVSSTLSTASEGESNHSSTSNLNRKNSAALDSCVKRRKINIDGVKNVKFNLTNEFDAEASDATNNDSSKEDLFMPERVNLHELGLRRSVRIKQQEQEQATKKSNKAYVTYGTRSKQLFGIFTLLCTVSDYTMPRHRSAVRPTFTQRAINRLDEANEHYDGTLNEFNFVALATDLGSNEVFTYCHAQKQKDWPLFVQAMEKEITDHEARDHWSLVKRSTVPLGVKTIKAIWSFKRKRFPDGRLNKHKARICAHGGMQEWGENYWETYSPVVNMLSVKLLLVIAKIHGLESKSIDFVLAFPQADLDVDIWMELPIGFDPQEDPDKSPRYVLKLNKNLYGLKQASFNWYEKLKEGLMNREFVPSEIDPCLYLKPRSKGYSNTSHQLSSSYSSSDSQSRSKISTDTIIHGGMIVLTYVDDCIIIGDSMKEIDDFVYSMQHGPENFDLTDEGDIDKFLGIEITPRKDGGFEMSQPYLIDRILAFLKLESNGHDVAPTDRMTPVAGQILDKDLEGKPRKKSWKYRTAVGMLSYLQGNTRPDISMAVHQTARFSNDPKLCHEQAITRIGRYLRHSRDRGVIFKPDKSKGLECYVDADFAGGWNPMNPNDASNLMSRTGFVIKYADCPIYFSSKLQTEIALSTAEAEYIALSSSLRQVIPLMTLMEETDTVFPLYIDKPNFHCKVWEDNQSCIAMATSQKFSPRTKHIALKYHHFRSFVNDRIRISYIHTESQQADIFTKPVKAELFFRLRYMLMGW